MPRTRKSQFGNTGSGGYAPAAIPRAVAGGGAGAPFENVVWYDDFNYSVSRASMTDAVANPFVSNGPWSNAKSEEFDAGAKGYIYTVDPTTDIAGNTVNPALSSNRALCLEGVSASEYAGVQGDFYLQRGDGLGLDDDVLPADVWIQFWFNMYGPLRAGSMKFLYPCRDGHGQCNDLSWLFMIRPYAGNPSCANADADTDAFFFDWGDNGQAGDSVTWPGSCDGDPKKKGVQTADANFSTVFTDSFNSNTVNQIDMNQWYLLKLHYDTSGAQGTFEMWARKYGDATWYKVMDWRGGVYPSGFDWTLAAPNQRGHNALRIATTWDTNDCKLYMADWQVATSEANLENSYNDF